MNCVGRNPSPHVLGINNTVSFTALQFFEVEKIAVWIFFYIFFINIIIIYFIRLSFFKEEVRRKEEVHGYLN